MVVADSFTVKRGEMAWAESRTDLLGVALATIMAAVLSLLFIGSKSLWLDEGSSIYFAREGASLWQKLAHREGNMWLYYLLLHLWLRLGDSEVMARGLSALFAAATVPLLYGLGRRLCGSRAGVMASILLASNAYFIQYAQEARGYTLLVFLIVLSSYFFVRAVDEGTWGSWIGHGMVLGLAIHTHYFAALVYLAHGVSLLLLGRKTRSWIGFLLSTAILTAWLVPIVLFQPLGSDQLLWVQPLTWQHVLWFFVQMAGGNRPLLLLYLVFWIVALAAVARKRAERASAQEPWNYLFLLAWIVVPVAVATGYSLLVTPAFVYRYLIVSLPPLVLLAGAGIARVRPRWLYVPVLFLFLCGSARCLHRWYNRDAWDDWRSATTYVLSQTHAGDAALFYVGSGKRSFDYYCSRLGGLASPMTLDLAQEARRGRKLWIQVDAQLLSSLPTRYGRMWLLLSHDFAFPDSSDRAQILGHLDTHYTLQSERDFPGVKVRLYEKPAPPLLAAP